MPGSLAATATTLLLLASGCTSSVERTADSGSGSDANGAQEMDSAMQSALPPDTGDASAWSVLPLCPELEGNGCKIKIYPVEDNPMNTVGDGGDEVLSCEFPLLVIDSEYGHTNLNVQYTIDGGDPVCFPLVNEGGDDVDGWRFVLDENGDIEWSNIILSGNACQIVRQGATSSVDIHILYDCNGLGGLVAGSKLL